MSAYPAEGNMSEGSDRQKVVITNERTKVTTGTEVQEKLIVAARVFSDLLKPTFGPRGLDKMMFKTDGSTSVTNDGAKIVAELLVKHPAAKMMVSMAESQEEACGDGVTTTMLLCGSLLIEANSLLRKGLHPLTLVDGYAISLEACRGQIESDSVEPNKEQLLSVSETALRGKVAEGAISDLPPIIVQAINTIHENRGEAGAEHISMFKTRTGGIRDSRLVRGVIFRRRVMMDGLPNDISNARVACLDGDLKIREMARDAELKISKAEVLDSFLEAEKNRKESIFESISRSGANVVLCSGEVDKDILHLLCENRVLVVGELDSSELRNASEATGSMIVDTPLDIQESDLGFSGRVSWERRQETDEVEDVFRIDECQSPCIVTIEVGGAGETATEEVIRGLHDSLRATSLALNQQVLPGAGAIHSRMAQAVREASEKQGGRERLAMEAFSRALETIPATLAENGGGDPLDRILELRAASIEDNPIGISSEGKTWKVEDVWHPRSVIENSLESATETAMGMLRIDQVISARGE
tara:strand:- start:463 stop:2055 length:1593 start_codon:yes stop_codon:yes gene_type:complete